MAFRMAAVRRSTSGTYTVRKGIPKDVQDEYQRLYGQRWEAKFSAPAGMRPQDAKAKGAEFLSEVEARISAIRAQQRGDRQALTQRQAHGLAGEWYRWFIAQNEENPGSPDQWNEYFWLLIDALRDYASEETLAAPSKAITDLTRDPEVREGVRSVIAKETKADQFLTNKGLSLSDDAYRLFLDCVLDEFVAAVLLLEKRAGGDYSPDARLATFPKFEAAPAQHKGSAGLTPWNLFEVWVSAKQPSTSTVNRWRAVFRLLDKHFADKPIDTITPDDAQHWAEQLLGKKAQPRTVNQIYCTAARTVFGWAVKTRKISNNPFVGVSVTEPRKVRTRETDEFTDGEATVILSASLKYDKVPERVFDAAKRWVPWLCAYTGARAGEITQLRGKDIVEQNGILVLQITPEAGTVKTGKPRTVPLHEHLIEQGFMDFVRAKGEGPLFYSETFPLKAKDDDLTNPRRPRSVKTRERIAQWVRELGVTDKAIRPNHAWRHTFKRKAARAGIEAGIRDAICGHSPRSVADQYETPTVADMAEALKKFPRYEIG